MSKYIDNLFGMYLKERKDKGLDVSCSLDEPNSQIKESLLEVGGIFAAKEGFLFVLISYNDGDAFGYKVSEWVDFATQEDFVFTFAKQRWVAIMECELQIPFRNLTKIGNLEKRDVDLLYDYFINGKPLPLTHVGLTIPMEDDSYPQVSFRLLEMTDVVKYLSFSLD